jgi:hypothetical protein
LQTTAAIVTRGPTGSPVRARITHRPLASRISAHQIPLQLVANKLSNKQTRRSPQPAD